MHVWVVRSTCMSFESLVRSLILSPRPDVRISIVQFKGAIPTLVSVFHFELAYTAYLFRCYWFHSRAEYSERNPPVAAEGIANGRLHAERTLWINESVPSSVSLRATLR